jgi:hypothetical protein
MAHAHCMLDAEGYRHIIKTHYNYSFTTSKMVTRSVSVLQDVLKKILSFATKSLLLILQHSKHCPLQSSLIYWWYTVHNFYSIFGMFPGTHFLCWSAVLLSHFPESPPWFRNDVLSKWFQFDMDMSYTRVLHIKVAYRVHHK